MDEGRQQPKKQGRAEEHGFHDPADDGNAARGVQGKSADPEPTLSSKVIQPPGRFSSVTWRLGILFMAAFFSLEAVVQAETSTQAVDRVWNYYVASSRGKANHEIFAKDFLLLSRDVAKEQGIAVLGPIMVRAKTWEDEECLSFVPLVCFLSRDQSTPVLNKYKREGKPWEQQAASDFLDEFTMSDTKEMIDSVPKK